MRGFLHMMEALLAGIIIIGFAIMLTGGNYLLRQAPVDLDSTAYSILKGIDSDGSLVQYADSFDYNSIGDQVSVPGYNSSIVICDESGTCAGYVPEIADVWAGTYVTAGDSSYSPRIVKLYLW